MEYNMSFKDEAAKLRDEISKKKIACYEYMKHLAQCSNDELIMCGHRNGLGAALESTIKKQMVEIEKSIKAIERKYPIGKD